MEAEIGVQLILRTKRSVKLTVAGDAFLKKAYEAVQRVDDAIQAARRAEKGEIGTLTIGFVPSASLGFLPKAISDFKENNQDVSIELQDLTTTEQIQLFAENKLDIGFVRPPFADTNLRRMSVIRESFIAALPENHPLAGVQTVSVSALRNDPFIIVPHILAPGLYSQIMEICSSSGFHPRIYQEIGQIDIIINFIAAGLGISILPQSVGMMKHDGVVYKPLEWMDIHAEIIAIWKEDPPSPILRNFITTVERTKKTFP